jgi:putative oxygen-independent coproporphyrinogen III oxidase
MVQNNIDSLSIYIHWPFCKSKCPYCDFNSHIYENIDYDLWEECYLKEIDNFSYIIKNRNLKSIFFGGGTPSLMKPKTVEKIIEKILFLSNKNHKDLEITLEANPTSVENSKFIDFKSAGINRVSIGVQSFDEMELKFLGRNHSSEEAMNAISIASRNFERFSFDLIYALPNQSLEAWKKTLHKAMEIAKTHISLYQLTIEVGTKFYSIHKSGGFELPSSELSSELYSITGEILAKNNFNHYEISNYAVRGQESVHNLSYWNYDEYIGIGPGAHGRIFENDNGSDETNEDVDRLYATTMIYAPEGWLRSVKENSSGLREKIPLSKSEIFAEIFMMGMRLSFGMNDSKLKKYLDLNFADIVDVRGNKIFDKLTSQGLIEISDNNMIAPTKRGILLNNYLVKSIVNEAKI